MLTQWQKNIAQLGWLNAVLYGLARLLDTASHGRWGLYRYHFVAQYLADAPLRPLRGADITVLMDEQKLADYPRPPSVIAARYGQGARSLSAWRKGRLAGFIWLIMHAYQEDEVRARFRLASPRACWDFDVWVHPDERLGWTFRRLWEAARAHLRARDVRWSCSRISAFNPGSLASHAHIGLVRMGGALFLRCGTWQWTCASLPPYFHLSRNARMYPEFIFDTSTLQEPPCPNAIKSAKS